MVEVEVEVGVGVGVGDRFSVRVSARVRIRIRVVLGFGFGLWFRSGLGFPLGFKVKLGLGRKIGCNIVEGSFLSSYCIHWRLISAFFFGVLYFGLFCLFFGSPFGSNPHSSNQTRTRILTHTQGFCPF